MTKTILCLVCFVLSWSYVSAEVTLPEKMPEHPRLYFNKQKEADIKGLMKTDPFLDKVVKELIKKADRAKTEPPTEAENQNKGYQMLVVTAMPQLERGQLMIRVVMKPEK